MSSGSSGWSWSWSFKLSQFEAPIGVLCGGPSAEREISLQSGQAVYEALRLIGLPVELLVLSKNPQEIPGQLRQANLGCAFVVLHGPYGEDGTLQALLEELHIPYTGSSAEACHFAMDKVSSRRRWLGAKLPVPKWVEAGPINAQIRTQGLPFPIVVKPVAQGSSFGMSIVDRPEEIPEAVEKAASYGERILLEEYLPGPEVTVGILEDQPLPVVQVIPKRRFYDTVAKYTPGMTQYLVPAPLPEETRRRVQDLALAAHEALGCRSFSRVDMILSSRRGPVLLELNTIPGMTKHSLLPKAAAAAGIDFPELCHRMLASALTPLET